MWCLVFTCTVLLFARCAESGDSEGFQRINNPVPADWGKDLTDDELISRGTFTVWMNTDTNGGTGDFENVKAILKKQEASNSCDLYCSKPLGVQWRLADSTHKSDIDKCLVLNVTKFSQLESMTYPGYNCLNAYQNDPSKADFCTKEKCIEIGMRKPGSRKRDITCDRCPDMEVRYLCRTAKPAGPCALIDKRTLEFEVDTQLEQLDNEIEEREKELSVMTAKASELEECEMRKREMGDDEEVEKLRSMLEQLVKEKF